MQIILKYFASGISFFFKVFFPVLIFSSTLSHAQVYAQVDWYRLYHIGNDGVNDAAMDNGFNTYLAGNTEGPDHYPDFRIIAFSRSGSLVFNVSFSSALKAFDDALSVAVDNEKNVYASGLATFGQSTNYGIIFKFTPEGNTAWSKYYSFPSIASHLVLDNNGNPVIGYLDYESNSAGFSKYSSSGDSLWTTLLTSDSGWLNINYLMSDRSGNIYALLYEQFTDNLQGFNIILIKMDGNGSVLWKRSFNGDSPRKIISDKQSNIILITHESGQLIKFGNNGDSIWSVNTYGFLTDVAVDSSNNIVVTGYKVPATGGFDYMTKKFSPEGSEIWSREFNSGNNDFAYCVESDKDNNIYVTGPQNSYQDYMRTFRYNPEGQTVWKHLFNLPLSNNTYPKKIFIDDSSNIYIAGSLTVIGVGSDFFLLKLNQHSGVGVKDDNISRIGFSLSQNYPNPFNPSTTIKYSLASDEFVTIKVTDILGREAALLVNEEKPAGTYEIKWSAERFPSGVYFYQLKAGSYIETIKMLLLK